MSTRAELIEELKGLLTIIIEYKQAEYEYEQATAMRKGVVRHSRPRVKDFDELHEHLFLREKLGDKPTMPHGAIKLLPPVYLAQKHQYKQAIDKYEAQKQSALVEYEKTYEEKRSELAEMDKLDNQKAIDDAEEKLVIAERNWNKAKLAFQANNIVASSLKKQNVVEKLIAYLEEDRVETLRDAINMYYDEERKDAEEKRNEEHRQEMLRLAQKKADAAQAAKEFQEKQYEEMKKAANNAERAADAAEMVWINNIINSD